MIINYKYCGFSNTYYAGSRKYDTYCFSPGFGEGRYGHYFYLTYVGCTKVPTKTNYCFLNSKQLIEYFKELSVLLGFDLISFSTTNSHFKLQIRCVANCRFALYISTLIRYTYEFPRSFLLYTALINKNNFPELNIIQIIQFYIALLQSGISNHTIGQEGFTFSNMNSKSQYNIICSDFNTSKGFVPIVKPDQVSIVRCFNLKQLDIIAAHINSIINKYYNENKANICCW